MILAGDIGGTHARIAWFKIDGGRIRFVVEEIYPTREHPGLEDVIDNFLRAHPSASEAACFGVAGPVRGGRVTMSNLGWSIEASSLARTIGIARVGLINDLEANAYGIAALEPHDFQVLNQGVADPSGNAAVISAGTGLGEAGLYFDGRVHRPFACEGGHADFAPADDLQAEMLRYLSVRFGHVSWERVLSGAGLLNVYHFLRDTRQGEEPAWLTAALAHGDPSEHISRAALEHRSALCETALDLFISIYGAEAGNLALKLMATAGVYVGGGIAARIAERLAGPGFMQAFAAKGRMSAILEAIPVKIILNDSAALYGAARAAALGASLIAA